MKHHGIGTRYILFKLYNIILFFLCPLLLLIIRVEQSENPVEKIKL